MAFFDPTRSLLSLPYTSISTARAHHKICALSRVFYPESPTCSEHLMTRGFSRLASLSGADGDADEEAVDNEPLLRDKYGC